jgi:hypothetical protein
MIDYFYKLNNQLLSKDSIEEYMNQKTKWMHVHGFDIVQVPVSVYSQDKILVDLINEFGGEALLLRLPPWKLYNWHQDVTRSVVINSIIEGFDCFTFYSDHVPDLATEAFTDISEIVYQPTDMFLLNTQKAHGVYNRSQRRTVLSVSFNMPIEYKTVLEHCIKNSY